MSERHLKAIKAAIVTALPPGCRLINVVEEAPKKGFALRRPPAAGASGTHVAIRIRGWGPSLEASGIVIRSLYDPSLDEDAAVKAVASGAAPVIQRQRKLSAEARGAGLQQPLGVEDAARTGHLVVDVDAAATLAGHLGSIRAAREWLDRQMADHAAEMIPQIRLAEATEEMVRFLPEEPPEPIIRVVGAVLHLPFALDPIAPARGGGKGGDARPVWEDDALYLVDALPETVATAARGMSVQQIVDGTPVGHRRIMSVDVHDDFGLTMTTIVMEPDRGRVDDLLPPIES